MVKTREDIIKEAVEESDTIIMMGIAEVLKLLFWKDYSSGHISANDISTLVSDVHGFAQTGEETYGFLNPHLTFLEIESIRKKLGFTEPLPRPHRSDNY